MRQINGDGDEDEDGGAREEKSGAGAVRTRMYVRMAGGSEG